MRTNRPIQFLALLPFPLISLFGSGNQSLINPGVDDYLVAQREMNLSNRQQVDWVNEVFKDNILLNLAYLKNPNQPNKPNWDEVRKPFKYEFRLDPDQTFAFHEDVLPKYQGKVTHTTNAHFNFQEGFKSSRFLFGDGVCHLASLIYWVAKDAHLDVEVPNNHDFAQIPDIPREYGVSIYNYPGRKASNAQENLYITNNKSKPITFKFEYQDNKVTVSIFEQN